MKLVWQDRFQRLDGHVIGRRRVSSGGRQLITVRWADGRRGVFVEGAEPPEIRREPGAAS